MEITDAYNVYGSENVDFIDAVLVAYHHVMNAKIHSFDQKLMKLCR